jgi:AbrB family looped-hinge helix DNA binding protein
MSKVTSKFQVSIPRSFANQLRIRAGDEIEWRITGDELRISLSKQHSPITVDQRLESFDAATKRQSARNRRVRAEENRSTTETRRSRS